MAKQYFSPRVRRAEQKNARKERTVAIREFDEFLIEQEHRVRVTIGTRMARIHERTRKFTGDFYGEGDIVKLGEDDLLPAGDDLEIEVRDGRK